MYTWPWRTFALICVLILASQWSSLRSKALNHSGTSFLRHPFLTLDFSEEADGLVPSSSMDDFATEPVADVENLETDEDEFDDEQRMEISNEEYAKNLRGENHQQTVPVVSLQTIKPAEVPLYLDDERLEEHLEIQEREEIISGYVEARA